MQNRSGTLTMRNQAPIICSGMHAEAELTDAGLKSIPFWGWSSYRGHVLSIRISKFKKAATHKFMREPLLEPILIFQTSTVESCNRTKDFKNWRRPMTENERQELEFLRSENCKIIIHWMKCSLRKFTNATRTKWTREMVRGNVKATQFC